MERMPGRTDWLRLRTINVPSIATEARVADLKTAKTKNVAGRRTGLFSGVNSSIFSALKTMNALLVSVRYRQKKIK
ncbi:hypothetical protein Y032_0811g2466 [Ancylostoma ceylanicum]|uniref:Uncharacterized protein n=1 Tax=Ancylostoma ceylanicum TaxID=53326 RepID=A0A016WBP4_9BILA|nr:hypothetical protein Y032_0811g2466 [Ancylostoma ceylanicum]